MESVMVKIGKRGTLVIPSQIRQSYGLADGDFMSVEGRQEGILLRPVMTMPIEKYSQEEKARFLLANTVTEEDRAWAAAEIRRMGLDPEVFTDIERPTPTGP
jgi:AbrB family looped-hinge helix DNA binding protein